MKKYALAFSYAVSLAATMLVGACSKPPEAAAAAPTSASNASAPSVSDIDVTEHVKTALLQSDMLSGLDITVVTTNGDVRLNGVLNSQAQVDEAIKIARASDGTHAIHDELTIKK